MTEFSNRKCKVPYQFTNLVNLADLQDLIYKTSIITSFKVPESSGMGITRLVSDSFSIYDAEDIICNKFAVYSNSCKVWKHKT